MLELTLRFKIALALLAIYTIWGSTYLGIRFAIQTIPPFLMAAIRFIIAGAALLTWAALKRTVRPNWTNWRAATVVGGLLLLGGNGGVVWAEQTVSSSLAAVLITTVPIWMAILESFQKDRRVPNSQIILGLGMGFAGVVLLAGPIDLGGTSVNPLGTAVLIFASFCWAVGSIYSRRAPTPKSQLQGIGMEMFAGGVLLGVAAIISGESGKFQVATISTASLLALIYLIVFGSLVGFTSYIWLLKKIPTSRVSTYAYVNPLVAIVLGVGLAGEQLTPRTLIASAVIVIAVFVITTFREKQGSWPISLHHNFRRGSVFLAHLRRYD